MSNNNEHDHEFDEIDCLQAIEQLYAYLDGELTDLEIKQFEQHMGHCRSCYSRKELETQLTKKLQESNEGNVPKSLQGRIKNIIDNI